MLITLGIDTQFGMLEGVITPILDAKLFRGLRIEVLTGEFLEKPIFHQLFQ